MAGPSGGRVERWGGSHAGGWAEWWNSGGAEWWNSGTVVQAKPDAKSRPSREVFGVWVFGGFCEGILVHACHAWRIDERARGSVLVRP